MVAEIIHLDTRKSASRHRTTKPTVAEPKNKVIRFYVPYRVDSHIAKPGEPGYMGTYTPQDPYGKDQDF